MSNIKAFQAKVMPKFVLYTSSSGTWTFPSNIVKDGSGNATVLITAIGGGGGGSRDTIGAWGGSSGESIQRMPHSASGNLAYAIGAGGAGKTSATGPGTVGSNTTVAGLTLSGGIPGNDSFSPASWSGPSASGGFAHTSDIYTMPQPHPGIFGGPAGEGGCGGGGGIVLDETGKAAIDSGGTGHTGTRGYGGIGYGAGGGGSANGTDGGTGASGAVLLEWWEYI